tara:strand:- start:532 stop:960 length:429 start_codon:yes stop_codon:yes gene_type:complete
MKNNKLSKDDLLEKDTNKVACPFLQVNVYDVGLGYQEDEGNQDDDGHGFYFKKTHDSTPGSPELTVRIKAGSDKKTIITMLSKIKVMVENNLEHIDFFAEEENEKRERREKLNKLSKDLSDSNLSLYELKRYLIDKERIPFE